MFIAPFAGAMSDRVSPKRILSIGLTLQAIALGWIAFVSTPTTPYTALIVPFVLAGVGMALFFTPMANLVLSSVRREQEGQASGANNAIRELGGVFGVAVLASVFSRYGGYETGQTFVDGMTPALWIGAVVVGLGAVAAFAIPAVRTRRASEVGGARAADRRRLILDSDGPGRDRRVRRGPGRCCFSTGVSSALLHLIATRARLVTLVSAGRPRRRLRRSGAP